MSYETSIDLFDFYEKGISNKFPDTLGLRNNGGNQPDLSHISAYYTLGDTDPNPPHKSVPEPATSVALGLFALASFGFLNNKKSKS